MSTSSTPTQEETKAPTAEAPAATEEKKGCGAAIGGGMALIAILACGIVSARKRED